MYQNVMFTGLVASEVRTVEDNGILFLVKSVKSYTANDGTLKTATARIIVNVPGKYGDALQDRIHPGLRVSVRGSIMANENGNPLIREDTEKGVWTAFDVKSVSVRILGVLAEGQLQEDEFSIILVGNVGRDPEMRLLPTTADEVTNFSMATNSAHKNEAGETIKETIWWRVTAWRRQAQTVNEFVKKGTRILVEGALVFDTETGAPRLWDRNDGTKGASFEVTLFIYKLLEKREGSSSPYQGSPNEAGESHYDDEIPF